MKINKKNFADLTRPLQQKIHVDVPTEKGPLSFCVDPLPIGFYEDLERLLPTPNPPAVGFVREKNNRFAKDENGSLIKDYDEQDPKYLGQIRDNSRRQNTAILYHLLITDPDIVFEAERKEDQKESDFFDSIYEELKSAGMSASQQLSILQAMNKAAGIDEEQIEAAKKN